VEQHDDNPKPGDSTPPPCSLLKRPRRCCCSRRPCIRAAQPQASSFADEDGDHKQRVMNRKLKPSCRLPRLQPVRRNAPAISLSVAAVPGELNREPSSSQPCSTPSPHEELHPRRPPEHCRCRSPLRHCLGHRGKPLSGPSLSSPRLLLSPPRPPEATPPLGPRRR
jgi:hypothetical protein